MRPRARIRCSRRWTAWTARIFRQADPQSHSMLLERGLFRIFLPWPPKAADGSTIEPEFTLEVVRDPTGCNTHPEYGLEERAIRWCRSIGGRVPWPISGTSRTRGSACSHSSARTDCRRAAIPTAGSRAAMNLLSDARQPTLGTQAVEAAVTHLQFDGKLDDERLRRIVDFERQIYVAQTSARDGGRSHGGRRVRRASASGIWRRGP